jgi:hypothetical protein
MKELLKDIQTLVIKHKFTILCIIVIAYLVMDWPDIKQGFIDGWLNKQNKHIVW